MIFPQEVLRGQSLRNTLRIRSGTNHNIALSKYLVDDFCAGRGRLVQSVEVCSCLTLAEDRVSIAIEEVKLLSRIQVNRMTIVIAVLQERF